MKSSKITDWCHHFIAEAVKEGDLCADATMGNGHDTVLLSKLTGPSGHVFAFDIQEEALNRTRLLLHTSDCPDNTTLLLKTHTEMDTVLKPSSVSCITFNFGYLPGGDHTKATTPKTSVPAIRKALPLLKPGGLMSLCIYSGKDTGFAEKEAILQFIKTLSPKDYLVLKTEYYNRPNHPPVPVLIYRLR